MIFHGSIFYLDQPVIQPVIRLYFSMKTTIQREMPFLAGLGKPRFVAPEIVAAWGSYREAVVWCWESRINTGAGEKTDQAMCANQLGMHTPHMSRCVNPDAAAPMNLSPECLPGFEAFCGWHGVSQYLARRKQMTFMEQILDERRVAV
jgi:hypothetical protein